MEIFSDTFVCSPHESNPEYSFHSSSQGYTSCSSEVPWPSRPPSAWAPAPISQKKEHILPPTWITTNIDPLVSAWKRPIPLCHIALRDHLVLTTGFHGWGALGDEIRDPIS